MDGTVLIAAVKYVCGSEGGGGGVCVCVCVCVCVTVWVLV